MTKPWQLEPNEPVTIYMAELRRKRLLKIGSTRGKAASRVNSFRHVACVPIAVPNSGKWRLVGEFRASRSLEKKLHRVLAPFCKYGREWYVDCPQVRAAFTLLVDELGR